MAQAVHVPAGRYTEPLSGIVYDSVRRVDIAEHYEATIAGHGLAYAVFREFDEESIVPGFAYVAAVGTGFTAYACDRDGSPSKRLGFAPSLADAKTLCADHATAAQAKRRQQSAMRSVRNSLWSLYRYGAA